MNLQKLTVLLIAHTIHVAPEDLPTPTLIKLVRDGYLSIENGKVDTTDKGKELISRIYIKPVGHDECTFNINEPISKTTVGLMLGALSKRGCTALVLEPHDLRGINPQEVEDVMLLAATRYISSKIEEALNADTI